MEGGRRTLEDDKYHNTHNELVNW